MLVNLPRLFVKLYKQIKSKVALNPVHLMHPVPFPVFPVLLEIKGSQKKNLLAEQFASPFSSYFASVANYSWIHETSEVCNASWVKTLIYGQRHT